MIEKSAWERCHLNHIIPNGFHLQIISDQIILCTLSFPLFMSNSAVAKEEELGGVPWVTQERRISTQATASTRVSSPANTFICSTLAGGDLEED